MVFPSAPVYVDPPKWNQQQVQHQLGSGGGGGGGRNEAPQLPPPPPPGLVGAEVGMAASTIRPGSMAERARLAKIAQPEQALKCPRCDSTNTKFCYFNNYSLAQPRHFCKTCRRYWTRGGALRNVPVGGGCRRNKRTKSGGGSSAKSTITSANRHSGASSSAIISGAMTSGATLQPPPLMTSLHPVPDCRTRSLGLSFGGIQSLDAVDYHVSGSSGVGLENLRFHHQQIQQFPLILGGSSVPLPLPPPPRMPPLAPLPSFYPSFIEESSCRGRFRPPAGLLMQLASVKMEDNNAQDELSLPRQYFGEPRNDPIWGGSAGGGSSNGGWPTSFSSFNSSSTDTFL